MATLNELKAFTDALPTQSKKMPVLFTSHGNPMDIPVSRSDREFWQKLYDLGINLQKNYEVKAALVVSAHWCTKGTFVNVSPDQKQITTMVFPKNTTKCITMPKVRPILPAK